MAQPPRVSVGQVATAAAGECLPGVDRRRGRLVATAAAGNCRPNNDLSRGRSSAGRQPLLPAIVGQVATAAAGEFRPVQGVTPLPDLHPGLLVLPLVSCRSGPGVSRRGLQADTQKKEDVFRRSMIGPWPPQGVSRWYGSGQRHTGVLGGAPRRLRATSSARVCSRRQMQGSTQYLTETAGLPL